MSEKKHIDYVGFTFNGIHSSSLGIVRTSEGSRFNENLLPTIQDKTVQVPGGDGMYHFGSYYTQKQFNIPYAFDSLTEEQLAKIKQVFGDKKIHDLIFDEAPYKIYQVKVTGTSSIKHIPFAEGAVNRIYKGEGTIQFTAYYPYALCKRKYLSDEYYSNFDNVQEWNAAAKLLESQQENGRSFDILNGNKVNLYNPGDKETDFILTLNFASGVIPQGQIEVDGKILILNRISLENEAIDKRDDQIKINTKLNLIEGYKNGKKSGKIYNQYIKGGSFFKIPTTVEKTSPIQMIFDGLSGNYENLEYNYLYF